ncbi:recombinase RecT, partial [Escherichia coli]
FHFHHNRFGIRIRYTSLGNNGPWVTHWEEMAKKTAIRRLFKYLPVSIEIQRAVSMDEKEPLTIDPADSSVLTGEYSVIDNSEE